MNNQPKITGDLSVEEQIDRVKKFNNPEVVPEILKKLPVDMINEGEGEFGKSPNNPIPVNGAHGERVYLSFLRCNVCEEEVLFHRIGSLRSKYNLIVDNYEVCCYKGCTRENIYLTPYFPKRSIYLPKGYLDVNLDRNSLAFKLFIDFPISLGSNWNIRNFPFGLEDFINFHFTEVVGNPSMARERLKRYKEITDFLKEKLYSEDASHNNIKDLNLKINLLFEDIYEKVKNISINEINNEYALCPANLWKDRLVDIIVIKSRQDQSIEDVIFPVDENIDKHVKENPYIRRTFYDINKKRNILPGFFSEFFRILKSNKQYAELTENVAKKLSEDNEYEKSADYYKEFIAFR